jgi:hypothetical protein
VDLKGKEHVPESVYHLVYDIDPAQVSYIHTYICTYTGWISRARSTYQNLYII